MEDRKRVLLSSAFENDIQNIFEYGYETFGLQAAENYKRRLAELSYRLDELYLLYPECKWLPTKGRIYRNIILDAHLIIYRIKSERIEVLRALHSHSSITRIRSSRSIRI